MAVVNDKELEDILGECFSWLPKVMKLMECIAPDDVTNGACRRVMKDTLALSFLKLYQFVRFQVDTMSSTKSQLIENQQWVIK